ncbi:MAG: DUF4317 domain-containing protein [Lachnospiraceae bacterium]
MNKKEVLEIRKQFSPANCAITRMCSCYVDHEKNKVCEYRQAFLSLPEEESFKYFDIFRHTLSGTLGKNLINMEFPLDSEMPGGTQEFLLKLRNSELKDEMLVEEFYDRIIENFDYGENYYIVLIYAAYDVPGRASDGMEMEDASDTVFAHILCSICPVKLSKAALSYNPHTNLMEDRIRDWIVEAPVSGFLFPAFHDRATDLHAMLYYSKNPEQLQEALIENVFGAGIPVTAKSQKEIFDTVVSGTLGENCDFEVVRNIHDHLCEMLEEHKESPEPLTLSKLDVKRLLEDSGASEEKMQVFEQEYDAAAGKDTKLLAGNIASARKFSVETPDIVIRVNPERADLIETKEIDGRKCIVIAIDDHVKVNGVNVRL